MRSDYYYNSCGSGLIRAGVWTPDAEPVAVIQLVHGIAEHIERYDDFAQYLSRHGFIVAAEDHMGHGKSIGNGGTQGYFHGGWFSAVEDTCQLMQDMKKKYPGLPYILYGHSMGSFIVRSILAKFPEYDINGCVICGTAWQPKLLLAAAIPLANYLCKTEGEEQPNKKLQKIMFGGYNNKIEHVRTENDWLTRDNKIVDAYNADPLCGFTPTAGLARDMLIGIEYIQRPASLTAMKKELPILFVAGGDDPVGNYGKGVKQAATEFERAGMRNVSCKIYPMCRHEILNEINRKEVYNDILNWINTQVAVDKV